MAPLTPRIAGLFFEHWYCENGLPSSIVSDHESQFVSSFWRTLHRLSSIHLAMSTSFHLETNGSSKRTNKTVIQMLRGFINRNQSCSVKALPHVRFSMMNTTNASTGFSPFQLRLGHLPGLIPLFVMANLETPHSDIEALMLLDVHHNLILQAQDNLLHSKVTQAWDEDEDKMKMKTR